MTDELLALLRRVEAAGGPVEVNASGEVAFVQLSPRCEVTLDLEAGSREQPRNDALLIHALRQDAASRGARAHDYESWPELEPPLYVALVKGMSDASIRGRGRHTAEAGAWLLAWLGAFEAAE